MLAACVPTSQIRVGGLPAREQTRAKAAALAPAPAPALNAKKWPSQFVRGHTARAKTGLVGRKHAVSVTAAAYDDPKKMTFNNGQATIKVRL